MTTNGSPLLIFSSKVDVATDHVILKLEKLDAKFCRINCEDFPLGATSTLAIDNSHASTRLEWVTSLDVSIDLSAVRSVWFRRHRLAPMPKEMEPAYQEYCLRESDWFIKGIIYSVDKSASPVSWMNHPSVSQLAESKAYQLSIARDVGFAIPSTLISNDPDAVLRFWAETEGKMIAKPVRMGYFDFGDRQSCVFTSIIEEQHLRDDDAIRVAPVIYQQHLSKLCDVRVTIVGAKIFAAAIDSQSVPSAVVDWRRSETDELGHSIHELPAPIANKCLVFMTKMGLNFGALDFILTPDNEYVFLEVNSSGQWVWLEEKLKLPISQTIAEWLWAGCR